MGAETSHLIDHARNLAEAVGNHRHIFKAGNEAVIEVAPGFRADNAQPDPVVVDITPTNPCVTIPLQNFTGMLVIRYTKCHQDENDRSDSIRNMEDYGNSYAREIDSPETDEVAEKAVPFLSVSFPSHVNEDTNSEDPNGESDFYVRDQDDNGLDLDIEAAVGRSQVVLDESVTPCNADFLDAIPEAQHESTHHDEDSSGGQEDSVSTLHCWSEDMKPSAASGAELYESKWGQVRQGLRRMDKPLIQRTDSRSRQMVARMPRNIDPIMMVSDSSSLASAPPEQSQRSLSKQWSVLLQMARTKRSMPQHVRTSRLMSKTQSQGSIGSIAHATKLHELCNEPDVTLQELENALSDEATAAATRDNQGRLPLHILGDNERLISDPQGKVIATHFALKLMQSYPEAITVRDNNGLVPFTSLIVDWCHWVYEAHANRQPKRPSLGGLSMGFGTSLQQRSSNLQRTVSSSSDEFSVSGSSTALTSSVVTTHFKAFPRAELWDEVYWCFSILSLAMDELAGKNGGLFKARSRANSRRFDKEARNELAAIIVDAVPNLIKTVLLIEDEGGDDRTSFLNLSIFRRCLLCPQSAGPWLTDMLRRSGAPAKHAVDYLAFVSQLTKEDHGGSFRASTEEDIKEFNEDRKSLFEAIEALEGLVPSMVSLEQKEIERVAATSVVWYIMGKNLARPFVVGLVLIDLALHITLMLSFRTDVEFSNKSTLSTVPTPLVIFICSHYLIRKGCEAVSLLNLSVGVFRAYFANIWTLFDVFAIALTLAAYVYNDNNPGEYRNGFNAFVTGLLWMKVLGFLKVVNKQMATFILSLAEILKDLRYFAFILLVIIIMFGDMMHIAVSTKDDGSICETHQAELNPPTRDFCSANEGDAYLRVYALLLGDFQIDEWRDSSGLTILFVLFTLVGVIIMLNVLIAIISDSYERAKMKSLLLFGRARVTFVAQNQALESFLQPGHNMARILDVCSRSPTKWGLGGHLIRWLVLVSLVGTAMYTEVFLASRTVLYAREGKNFFTLAIVSGLFLLLTLALWIVIAHSVSGLVMSIAPRSIKALFAKVDVCSDRFVRWIADRLFGLQHGGKNRSSIDSDESYREMEDEWAGRLSYMEKSFQQSLEQARQRLSKEMMAMEERIYERQTLMGGSPSHHVP